MFCVYILMFRVSINAPEENKVGAAGPPRRTFRIRGALPNKMHGKMKLCARHAQRRAIGTRTHFGTVYASSLTGEAMQPCHEDSLAENAKYHMKLSRFLLNSSCIHFTEIIAESFGTDWRNRSSVRVRVFQPQFHSNAH